MVDKDQCTLQLRPIYLLFVMFFWRKLINKELELFQFDRKELLSHKQNSYHTSMIQTYVGPSSSHGLFGQRICYI